MNFLLRTTAHPLSPEQNVESKHGEAVTNERMTLQGLFGEDSCSKSSVSEDGDKENDDCGAARGSASDPTTLSKISVGGHSDVTEEEGRITIPYKPLPLDWHLAPDIGTLSTIDRSFLFPGEQIHILACLATSKEDSEVITPVNVAAISRNHNIEHTTKSQMEDVADIGTFVDAHDGPDKSSENIENGLYQQFTENHSQENLLATESFVGNQWQKTKLLEKLKKSHFFVRISDSDLPLWSKKGNATSSDARPAKISIADNHLSAIIDRGTFNVVSSGGIVRNSVSCHSLSNGDIVVLLQVNVETDAMKDPVIEILQFEQFPVECGAYKRNMAMESHDDPCEELLTWLLPLDHSLPPRPSSVTSPAQSIAGASHRPTLSASSSQIFSFSHFRSYSMPSVPQNSVPPSLSPPPAAKSNFDLEDFSEFTTEKTTKSHFVGMGSLSSFRGVPLEPERYSVQCGLGGIYLPGKRWKRKIEIVQPIEIHTFAADCNTEDLICVQIKNVSPAHLPDIVIFLDSIDIVFEEAPKDGPPLCLPITCIEAGNGYSLPNLALRKGEEHSFVLKPAGAVAKNLKVATNKVSQSMQLRVGNSGLSAILTGKASDGTNYPNKSHYAVLVSCRCNYTESKLFFKKQTNWQPRLPKDLMISVASEICARNFSPERKKSQLPVQTLTLEASNLTTEDMTLTVLAPASLTAPPSVVSLNSAPTSPASPFSSFPKFAERVNSMQRSNSIPSQEVWKENGNSGTRSISLTDRTTPVPEVLPNSELGCTHLWLQSTVPLGCIPAQSSSTVMLELLPLTDGIITLDTLQIAAKEKGLTYVPERSLKIHATSSVATGIM